MVKTRRLYLTCTRSRADHSLLMSHFSS